MLSQQRSFPIQVPLQHLEGATHAGQHLSVSIQDPSQHFLPVGQHDPPLLHLSSRQHSSFEPSFSQVSSSQIFPSVGSQQSSAPIQLPIPFLLQHLFEDGQ